MREKNNINVENIIMIIVIMLIGILIIFMYINSKYEIIIRINESDEIVINNNTIFYSTIIPFDKYEIINNCTKIYLDNLELDMNKIIINLDHLKDIEIHTHKGTSMYPSIQQNGIHLGFRNVSEDDICVGDMIVFNDTCSKNNQSFYWVLHRIVDIKNDNEGIYYLTKGDNNDYIDECKVRLDDITSVVFGVFY